MLAIEIIGYQLVEDRNLIKVVLGFLTFPFGGKGDTRERALSSHQNLVWGQATFSHSIMKV
jgi:hypothetical protein